MFSSRDIFSLLVPSEKTGSFSSFLLRKFFVSSLNKLSNTQILFLAWVCLHLECLGSLILLRVIGDGEAEEGIRRTQNKK